MTEMASRMGKVGKTSRRHRIEWHSSRSHDFGGISTVSGFSVLADGVFETVWLVEKELQMLMHAYPL